MKEIRTFGVYRYSVELEPKVSTVVDEKELSIDIQWTFNIKLLDHPQGLTGDMIRGILNFIGEMEEAYIKAQMKSTIKNSNSEFDKYKGTNDRPDNKISPHWDPIRDPYSPYGKLIFADKGSDDKRPQFNSDIK